MEQLKSDLKSMYKNTHLTFLWQKWELCSIFNIGYKDVVIRLCHLSIFFFFFLVDTRDCITFKMFTDSVSLFLFWIVVLFLCLHLHWQIFHTLLNRLNFWIFLKLEQKNLLRADLNMKIYSVRAYTGWFQHSFKNIPYYGKTLKIRCALLYYFPFSFECNLCKGRKSSKIGKQIKRNGRHFTRYEKNCQMWSWFETFTLIVNKKNAVTVVIIQ